MSSLRARRWAAHVLREAAGRIEHPHLFVWWDRALWWRSYTPGGFDGYRTLTGRREPCANIYTLAGLRDDR